MSSNSTTKPVPANAKFQEFRKLDYGVLSAVACITGFISVFSSVILCVHILRSHLKLSTTYHRLVFGLAVFDIISSTAYLLGPIMVPEEMSYITPFAQGNQATCDVQGFLVHSGQPGAALYNCSISLYYMAIIVFRKRDDFIRNKLEPWFHAVPITFSFALSSTALALESYNPMGGMCRFLESPHQQHCEGYEDGEIPDGFSIPCGRGDGSFYPKLYKVVHYGMYGYPFFAPVVIVGTMSTMYYSVWKTEKRLMKYGVGSLRVRAAALPSLRVRTAALPSDSNNTESSNSICNMVKKFLERLLPTCFHRCGLLTSGVGSIPRSNNLTSHKRAILNKAAGYALAWFVPYFPWVLAVFIHYSVSTHFLYNLLNPLQGLFNLCVYISPKVQIARNSPILAASSPNGRTLPGQQENNVTWCRAIFNALMSRGERAQTLTRSRYTRNLSTRISSSISRIRSSTSSFFRSVFKNSTRSSPSLRFGQSILQHSSSDHNHKQRSYVASILKKPRTSLHVSKINEERERRDQGEEDFLPLSLDEFAGDVEDVVKSKGPQLMVSFALANDVKDKNEEISSTLDHQEHDHPDRQMEAILELSHSAEIASDDMIDRCVELSSPVISERSQVRVSFAPANDERDNNEEISSTQEE
jgi:hypothetical protein